MNRPWILLLILGLSFTGLSRPAAADLNVGDSPTINWKTIDGKTLDKKALDGWVVAIVFWSSTDKWMLGADMPIFKIEPEDHLRGVKFITINTDAQVDDVRQWVKAQKITIPIVSEPKGLDGPLAKAWAIDRIPYGVVLSPSGKVTYMGHPNKIESQIDNAIHASPPQLSKEVWTEMAVTEVQLATKWLEAHKDNQDYRGALERIEAINPIAIDEPAVINAAKKMIPYFRSSKEQDQNSLQTFRSAYPRGSEQLDKLKVAVSKANEAAVSQPAELTPAQKKAIAAKSKLDAADALAAGSNVANRILAYKAYKQVVERYSGTEAAKTAAAKVKAMEADEKFMEAVKEATREEDAKSMLAMGRSYKRAGKDDLATQAFNDVIAKYPKTPWADEAQAELGK